jgi:PII-like signaling protein
MHATESVQRVRIYLSENDLIGGQALYLVTLDRLRAAGATGATVLRGITGFGPSHNLRLSSGTTSSAPVVIEWIDRTERVARVLPSLDSLLPNALITLEDVQIYRAVLRSSGPFGERTLHDLAIRDVASITTNTSISAAVRLMVLRNQPLLPVLDEEGRLVGAVREDELRRRGLPMLSLLRAFNDDERATLLGRLGEAGLNTLVTPEAQALATDATVLQAANTMLEWGQDILPVVGRDGRFFGLFGIDEALQAAQTTNGQGDGPIRDAQQPVPIQLLMQQAVQTILGYAPAGEALDRLLAAPEQPLFVVDNNRPIGLLMAGEVLRQAEEPLRSIWAAALMPGVAPSLESVRASAGDIRAASLPMLPLPALLTSASYGEAITLLRDRQVQWLAVVDDQNKLQGVVGHRTLLRALVQDSAA